MVNFSPSPFDERSFSSPYNDAHSNATDLNSASADAPIDIPLASLLNPLASSSARRVRSGSLFSTNSIWNDDPLLLHSPSRALLNGALLEELLSSSFISPVLSAQPPAVPIANPARNRSNTTSTHSTAFAAIAALDPPRISVSPFLLALPEPASLLDNLVLNLADPPHLHSLRNRSQTYSGVSPKLPDSGLAMHLSSRPAQLLHLAPGPALLHAGDLPNLSFDATFAGLHPVLLQDDLDIFAFSITTSFDNPNLGPTNTLFLDNLPPFVDALGLHKLLHSPGSVPLSMTAAGVTSVRVAHRPNSKLALVTCASIEAAMSIKASFNHLELVPGVILYVAFAKVVENVPLPSLALKPAASLGLMPLAHQANEPSDGRRKSPPKSVDMLATGSVEALMDTVSRLSASQAIDLKKVISMIKKAAAFPKSKYQSDFGPLPELEMVRQFDLARLRELRKALEVNEKAALGHGLDSDSSAGGEVLSQQELEELCLLMLDELPEICYDHVGNTVVQKVFTVVESAAIKLVMLKETAPFLSPLGIHKNGTWAVQKIINSSLDSCLPKVLIAESLQPYAVKLFNDQFGNYVLQCCLKFGSPFNDFIFETVYSNFLEISCGRFGLRCLRAILETSSEHSSTNSGVISTEQLFLVASLIVQHVTDLIVNNNGSPLITWFLDTFSGCKNAEDDLRYALLTDKLMPALDAFCIHKVASLTVYKILNNCVDAGARQRIMNALFGPVGDLEDAVRTELLETILLDTPDNTSGPLFVYKVLSNPAIFSVGSDDTSQKYHQCAIAQVKRILLESNIANQQPYKRLVEEVGLTPIKMSKSASGGRKAKRGNNHAGNGFSSRAGAGKGAASNMAYVAPAQMGPPVMGYGAYAAGPGIYAGTPYNTGFCGYAFAGQYADDTHAQRKQDFSVMQDLEQLSLSSVAMGYGSNPQTPLANVSFNNRGLFF